MLEMLTWWHWIVLGLILIVTEIIAPLFIVLWFGLAAIIVGLIDLAFATSFKIELLIWIVLSVLFLTVWFIFFRDKSVASRSGQSDFTLGTKGVVIEDILPNEKGKVRFEAPVLGSSEWYAISEGTLKKGDAVHIIEVKGQLLKMEGIE
jgi:membrane protein implicated in regulation of membrane protease activity